MDKTNQFITNIMRGVEASEEVVRSIREDANAGRFMSPAAQLVVANMMENDIAFIRQMATAIVAYEESLNNE